MRKVVSVAACVSVLALAACGSGDEASNAGGEPAPEAATEAQSSGSAPSVEEKRALIATFREGSPAGCADNFVEDTDDGEEGEMAGVSFVLCAGSESSEEPYTVVLITEGNDQLDAGTMDFYVRADPHPLAYEGIKDMIHTAAGIRSDAERVGFGAELGRFMMAGPNMPGNAYRTLYETSGGITTRVAPNNPGGGWIAVRVLP